MLELWAAGFNAHGQLNGEQGVPDDFLRFAPVAEGESLEVLSTSWSRTSLKQDESLTVLGHYSEDRDRGTCRMFRIRPGSPFTRCFCGDLPADICTISPDGRIDVVSAAVDLGGNASPFQLLPLGNDDSPRVSFVAVTTTGHTCVAMLQSPSSDLIHLLDFQSLEHFKDWYLDPVVADVESENHATSKFLRHFMLPGRVEQLEAGAAYFVLRTATGEVYTWTPDARQHRCLARSTSKESPANEPGLVDALGGIPIAKVAVGGWMAIALSRDGDAYAWGREKPQEGNASLSVLPGPDEDVRLIDVAESSSIKDVAVGSGHVLLLTEQGRLFSAGNNHNGQLGLEDASGRLHVEELTEVEGVKGKDIQHVWCGDCNSFLLVKK